MNTYDQSIIGCVVDHFHIRPSAKNSAIMRHGDNIGKKIVCDIE